MADCFTPHEISNVAVSTQTHRKLWKFLGQIYFLPLFRLHYTQIVWTNSSFSDWWIIKYQMTDDLNLCIVGSNVLYWLVSCESGWVKHVRIFLMPRAQITHTTTKTLYLEIFGDNSLNCDDSFFNLNMLFVWTQFYGFHCLPINNKKNILTHICTLPY